MIKYTDVDNESDILIDEEIKIGFLVDYLDDLIKFLLLQFYKPKDKKIKTYIICYEDSKLIQELRKFENLIILNSSDSPYKKYTIVKTLFLKLIIYFENFSYNVYEHNKMKKINQFLHFNPAKMNVILPYNLLNRKHIFQYVILEKSLFDQKNHSIFNNNLILYKNILYNKDIDDIFHYFLRIDSQILTENNISEDNSTNQEKELDLFIEYVVFGNLNECYKISYDLLNIWFNIINSFENSRLLLNYSSLSQVENILKFAESKKIPEDKIIFISCENYTEYINAFKNIDIYLENINFNYDHLSSFSQLINIPIVCNTSFKREIYLESFKYHYNRLNNSHRLVKRKARKIFINKITVKLFFILFRIFFLIAKKENKSNSLSQKKILL